MTTAKKQPKYRIVDMDTMVILDCYTEAGRDAYLDAIRMINHEPFLIDFTGQRKVA